MDERNIARQYHSASRAEPALVDVTINSEGETVGTITKQERDMFRVTTVAKVPTNHFWDELHYGKAAAHRVAAMQLRDSFDSEEAIVELRKALGVNPRYPRAILNLANLLWNEGLLLEAQLLLHDGLLIPESEGLTQGARYCFLCTLAAFQHQLARRAERASAQLPQGQYHRRLSLRLLDAALEYGEDAETLFDHAAICAELASEERELQVTATRSFSRACALDDSGGELLRLKLAEHPILDTLHTSD